MKKLLPQLILALCLPFLSFTQTHTDSLELEKGILIIDTLLEVEAYQEALAYCDSLLHLTEDSKNEQWARVAGLKGSIQTSLGNEEEALIQLNAALQYWLDLGDTINANVAGLYRSFGTVFLNAHRYEEGIQSRLKAKEIYEQTSGKKNLDYTTNLKNLAILYSNQGDYKETEALFEKVRELKEEILGKEHLEYGIGLSDLAVVNTFLGNYEKAASFHMEAQDIIVKVAGKENEDYIVSLLSLGGLYNKMGLYEKAETLFLEAEPIIRTVLGEAHSYYVHNLRSLGGIKRSQGVYDEAETYLLKAKQIVEEELGENHFEYSNVLFNLADFYESIGQYKKAEAINFEVIAIDARIYGKTHPYYATSINNLASLYFKMDAFELAEPLHLEALEIRKKALGEDHPDYAKGLNDLGMLYEAMGLYGKAEPLHLESLAIKEKSLGKEHPSYANSLINLAVLYLELGAYEKAESIYLQAKAIDEKTIGKTHPTYAIGISNLANLYILMGAYEKAEQYYLEALDIYEQVTGKDHPYYAGRTYALATLYNTMQQYDKAKTLFLEAQTLQKENERSQSTLYADILNGLAVNHQALRSYKQAEDLYLESLALKKRLLGKRHPYCALTMGALAKLYQQTRTYEKSEQIYLELYPLKKDLVASGFSFLSEMQKEKYLSRHFENDRRVIHSFGMLRNAAAISDMQYDLAIFSKGLKLAANLATMEFVLQENDTALLKSYRELVTLQRQLGKEYQKPIDQRKNTADLEQQKEAIEKQLARASAPFRKEQRTNTIKVSDIKSSLKSNEAGIEFVHFRKESTDSIIYAAALLLPEESFVVYIPLFEEDELKFLSDAQINRSAFVKNIYGVQTRGTGGLTPKKDKRETSLYELIWKPLDSILQNKERIYYCSTGLMNRLNLGAIAVDKEKVLADQYELINLSSTRLIALEEEEATKKTLDAYVIGGIDYEVQTDDSESVSRDSSFSAGGNNLEFASLNRSLRDQLWRYLPATQQEAQNIAGKLSDHGYNVQLAGGTEAREEDFKSLGTARPSPRIIHLATHGFFFPDPLVSEEEGSGQDPAFKLADHPMLRSGLLLSGANWVWRGEEPLPGREDGILTAYEIANMNLTNTELVVLSACETGLGEVQGSEGVYGLQRAFKKAGVKYLIMSLWQVPDLETSEFMTLFYKNWLDKNMTIRKAFQTAQLEMRDKYSNPYQWAGFVLLE